MIMEINSCEIEECIVATNRNHDAEALNTVYTQFSCIGGEEYYCAGGLLSQVPIARKLRVLLLIPLPLRQDSLK